MNGLFVFDLHNDIVYNKPNENINKKLHELAKKHELLPSDTDESKDIDTNIIVQLFSPLIASHRIMYCEFDNSYSSVQLEGDLNLVFEDFLGYLFLSIGPESVEYQQRYVGVCISFAKHLCGPDISMLKTMANKTDILTKLLDSWRDSYANDETMMVEGVQQLLYANADVRKVAHQSLTAASENLKRDPYSQRHHSILFVKNKLLTIYSSRPAQPLSTGDIIFLQLYCQRLIAESQETASADGKIHSHLVFLQGHVNATYAGCIPCIVHIGYLNDDVTMLTLLEYGSLQLSSALFDVFFAIHKIRILQIQNDIDNLRPTYESLDHYIRQTLDALKKAKFNSADVEAAAKKYANKWDLLRKKYLELFKNSDRDLVLAIESNVPTFVDALGELFRLTCAECNTMEYGVQRIAEMTSKIEEQLIEVAEFLPIPALQNYIISSVFKDINGLAHFIHINRSTGRVVVPHIDLDDKRGPLIKKQAWNMVKMARLYLQRGHLSLMWKDDAFYYSYFLWFEDANGSQLKPKQLPNVASGNAIKPDVVPGVIAGEFYQWLIESCFPKNNQKIKCFELFSMYIGLIAPHTLLDFNRRLLTILRDNLTGVEI